jgi:hypothetical protein
MVRIYLDNCSIQRPLDDQRFARIRLETEAVSLLLAMCYNGQAELITSEISVIENSNNPDFTRKAFGAGILEQAHECIAVTPSITARAEECIAHGIQAFDALHLACAEAASADYFCTCDDKLLKKARVFAKITVCTPFSCLENLI